MMTYIYNLTNFLYPFSFGLEWEGNKLSITGCKTGWLSNNSKQTSFMTNPNKTTYPPAFLSSFNNFIND
ncbi:hypothetical protein HanIR_Chr16g0809881 [Helianthus annuus]|nr:hypothetical protein HanIR_Chr16g0809881 [Helianthus annuus]